MSLSQLSPQHRAAARECIAFIVQSRELDGEFDTRIGVAEDQARELLLSWPAVDDSSDANNATLLINNAFNEVCHGIDISDAQWLRWFTTSRENVREAYRAWARARGWDHTGIR